MSSEKPQNFQRILCPMGLVNRDDPQASESSQRALALAGLLAAGRDATVYSMYVIPLFVMHMTGFQERPDPDAVDGLRWEPLTGGGIRREDPRVIAAARVGSYLGRLVPSDIKGEVVVRVGDPAARIIEFAEANKVDLVLLPAHRTSKGAAKGPLGTVAEKIVQKTSCSVTILR